MLESALKEQLKGIFAGLGQISLLIYPYRPVMRIVLNCWNFWEMWQTVPIISLIR